MAMIVYSTHSRFPELNPQQLIISSDITIDVSILEWRVLLYNRDPIINYNSKSESTW